MLGSVDVGMLLKQQQQLFAFYLTLFRPWSMDDKLDSQRLLESQSQDSFEDGQHDTTLTLREQLRQRRETRLVQYHQIALGLLLLLLVLTNIAWYLELRHTLSEWTSSKSTPHLSSVKELDYYKSPLSHYPRIHTDL